MMHSPTAPTPHDDPFGTATAVPIGVTTDGVDKSVDFSAGICTTIRTTDPAAPGVVSLLGTLIAAFRESHAWPHLMILDPRHVYREDDPEVPAWRYIGEIATDPDSIRNRLIDVAEIADARLDVLSERGGEALSVSALGGPLLLVVNGTSGVIRASADRSALIALLDIAASPNGPRVGLSIIIVDDATPTMAPALTATSYRVTDDIPTNPTPLVDVDICDRAEPSFRPWRVHGAPQGVLASLAMGHAGAVPVARLLHHATELRESVREKARRRSVLYPPPRPPRLRPSTAGRPRVDPTLQRTRND